VQTEYDAKRTDYLESRGYRVVRFSNRDVLRNREDVLATIALSLTVAPLTNSA
jgi:very-short-patch-repair endonuclease